MENSENPQYLNFLECIGRKGDIFLNMLILSRKQYFKILFEKPNLDDNVTFTIKDNDYSNNEINFEQLEYFDKYIKKKQKRKQYIFIINRAKIYIYSEFIQIYYSKNIFSFWLILYITYFL